MIFCNITQPVKLLLNKLSRQETWESKEFIINMVNCQKFYFVNVEQILKVLQIIGSVNFD